MTLLFQASQASASTSVGTTHNPTIQAPSEIQSDDKSSHSKGDDNILSHLVTPFNDLSPLAPEERRGEGTGVRGREQTGTSPCG